MPLFFDGIAGVVEAMRKHAETNQILQEHHDALVRALAERQPGEVDALGFIRISPTEKTVNGTVLVTAEQAKRAAPFGWKKIKHPDAKNGLVAVKK